MKRKKFSRRIDRVSSNDRVSGNEEAYLEIQNFLKALDSYPECFAQNPGVSFEQHHSCIMSVGCHQSGQSRQNGCDARES